MLKNDNCFCIEERETLSQLLSVLFLDKVCLNGKQVLVKKQLKVCLNTYFLQSQVGQSMNAFLKQNENALKEGESIRFQMIFSSGAAAPDFLAQIMRKRRGASCVPQPPASVQVLTAKVLRRLLSNFGLFCCFSLVSEVLFSEPP